MPHKEEKQLQLELEAQQHKLQELQVQNTELQFMNTFLDSFCEALDCARQHKGGDDAQTVPEEELELLRQLGRLRNAAGSMHSSMCSMHSSMCSSSTTDDGTVVAAGPAPPPPAGAATAARPAAVAATRSAAAAPMETVKEQQQQQEDAITSGNDMFGLYRQLLSAPPFPEAATMTLADVQADLTATVRELALYLQLHSQAAGQQSYISPAPLQRIRDILTRHMRLMATVALSNRCYQVMQMCVTPAETGQPMPQPDEQHHYFVTQQLGLSDEQLQQLALAYAVYKKMEMSAIQDISREGSRPVGPAAQPAAEAVASCSAAASAAAEALASQSWLGSEERYSAGTGPHFRLMQLQQQLAMRLRVQVYKDMHMKTCFTLFCYGRLTWVQLATLYVLMTPHFPTSTLVMAAAADLWNKRKAELQQQRRQEQLRQEPLAVAAAKAAAAAAAAARNP